MVNSVSGNSDYLAFLLKQLNTNSSTTTTTSTTALTSSASAKSPMSASDIFSKLTQELGGDGKTITKDELKTYMSKVESDTTGQYDKKELGFLNQLYNNWDKISGGSNSITENNIESGINYLKPSHHTHSRSSDSMPSDLFSSLSEAVGADSNGISKDELSTYLKKLLSESTSASDTASTTTTTSTTGATNTTSTNKTELGKEIKLIANLVANFDDFSSGNQYITSNSLLSAMKAPQDPSTITSDQLTSPIDLRV